MWPWSEPPAQLADGHARLRWFNVRLRPTRLGWGMALACVLLWVLAVNYQLNVAYILLFWLLGILFLGLLMSARQLVGWSLHMSMVGECFSGQLPKILLCSAENDAQTRWLWCCLGDADTDASWQTWVTGTHGVNTHEWALPPQQRGWLRVPPLLCAATAPLGLLLVEASWQYEGSAVVFPTPIKHHLPQRVQSGAAHSHMVASSGDDVAYLLPHHQAVSPRQIAWKQYAKSGELLDKWFDVGAEELITDVISFRDYPAHTGKDYLAGCLCFRVLQAEQQHQPYTLELPHTVIKPGAGQREQCLTALGLW